MAHVDFEEIRLAFRARVIAQSARFAAVVAAGNAEAENAPKDRAGGVTWTRETLFVAAEIGATIGDPLIETTGRIQFDLVVPIASGSSEAAAFAKEVAEAFRPGLGLTTAGGVGFVVDRSERLTAVVWDGTWYASGVSVLWRVYTPSGA